MQGGAKTGGAGSLRVDIEVFVELQSQSRVEDRFFSDGLFSSAKRLESIHRDGRVVIEGDQDRLSQSDGGCFFVGGSDKLQSEAAGERGVGRPLIDEKADGVGGLFQVAWLQGGIGGMRV